MDTSAVPVISSVPSEPNRCSHLDANQRRCRMLVSSAHPTLCAHHASQERQRALAARLASELTASAPGTRSAPEINRVLAQLFSAVSDRKIDLRQGALLAYIAQLMLQTIKLGEPQLPVSELPLRSS